MVSEVPGYPLWVMLLAQEEGCIGVALMDADAEELKAADSLCVLGSWDWLSPTPDCLPLSALRRHFLESSPCLCPHQKSSFLSD